MSRRLVIIVGAVVVVAAVAIGLSQADKGGGPPKVNHFDLQAAQRTLAGAPAPLAALHAQASLVLKGGSSAVQARLAGLKGHPVIVNKWASWCQPCRSEFPLLQQASVRFGKQVAFVGLDSGDGDGGSARSFLATYPLTYPSYVDTNSKAALALGLGGGFPTTAFYNAAGKATFEHQGLYSTQARLDADIAHYALGRP